jgi:2-polyprenyl-6-methoxyphenol hydroxylase-like FAD-dependent oxidoreductase
MKLVRQNLPCAGVDATSGYDIAIAGAGPAGSVLALLAARARYRVLLVEKSHFDRPRFGETAPPELRPALTRVGLSNSRKRRSVAMRPKCCRFGEATSPGHGTTSSRPTGPHCTSIAGHSTKHWPWRHAMRARI